MNQYEHTSTSRRIALVEDELILREEMAFQLKYHGFAVEAFENAPQLYRRLAVTQFDVVILDIGLDGEDGLSVCHYLRQHDSHIGIIFCTAKGQREDRLLGLDNGADAYLIKPIDIDELTLILRRLQQRTSPTAQPGSPPAPSHISVGKWLLDSATGLLRPPVGPPIKLSLSELQLLSRLMKNPEETAVHSELARALGILPEEFNKHRIEVIMSRLRDKVKRETGQSLPVFNKRGVGYIFSTPTVS